MDDYTLPSLTESKNIWCMTLLKIITPCINDGFNSIFNEALKVCEDTNEPDKYLLTFQTFLSRIPKWNQTIIDNERDRIIERSKCSYIDEMISCVHIVHLKALTCIRTGKKQKQIDIDIPNLANFIHKVYINTARQLYNSVYLYEMDVPSLDKQRNLVEIDNIIKTSILDTVNSSIPIESILRSYLEKDEEEEEIEQNDVNSNDNVVENVPNVEPILDNKDMDTHDKPGDIIISDTSNEQLSDGTTHDVPTRGDPPNDDDMSSDSEYISIGENVELSLDDIITSDNKQEDLLAGMIEEL